VRADRLVFWPDVQCRLLGARLSGYLASVQRSHLDVQVLIARCKPTDSQDLFFFEALIQWLLRWMVALQPDYEILNQALAEVVRTFWINPTQER
jgi:hypothetical protein